MNKIPVGRTIAFAYNFTFGHIGTVIGLIWLPLLIFFVGNFFVMSYYTQGLEGFLTGGDPGAFTKPLLAVMGFSILGIFFIAVIGVALTRQAMGLRTGTAIVHFGFGAAEFNLFLSFLAAILVVIAIYLGIVLAGVLFGVVGGIAITALTAAAGKAAATAGVAGLVIVVAIAMICVLMYVVARLTFLISPVTVVEGKIDLIRAWSLTKGNFWRIFAIGAATLLPMTLILIGAEVAILGPGYFIPNISNPTDTAAQMHNMAAQMHTLSANLPLLLGLSLLLAPFNYGLIFSAPAFAYRSIVAPPVIPGAPADTGPMRPA